jgi:hypothetical protein
MQAEQDLLIRSLRDQLPWHWRQVELEILFHGDGGTKGAPVVTSFLFARGRDDPGNMQLFGELLKLRAASKAHARGPIYWLRATLVRFKPAQVTYRHEGDYIERLEDIRLPPDFPGLPPELPMFPFKKAFERRLLVQLTPDEAQQALVHRASYLELPGQTMSAPYRELYSFSAFLGSVGNGGFDQWFNRQDTAHILGGGEEALISARAGALRLGLAEAVAAYDKGLAIFASQEDYVARACARLGIVPASPDAFEDDEQVNPLTRLVQQHASEWYLAIGKYVMANLDEFAD